MTVPVCAHRVITKNHMSNGDLLTATRVLDQILQRVPCPV
jgi:hypothetical protein